ncbi:MAG: hypothetical protein RLZZ366_749 [Pseudomonadota bacterium]
MTTASRFHGLTRFKAWLIVMITLLLMALSATSSMSTDTLPVFHTRAAAHAPITVDRDPDFRLYRTINARVAAGEGYYEVAADEQRREGYPLRPFITFRLPTLAWISAAIGASGMRLLIWGLMAFTLFAWWKRLDEVFDDPRRRIVAMLLLVSGLTLHARPELIVLHDLWAGLLVCLSFALHREDRWWPSMIAALAAVLIREITFPFVLLMAASALWRRQGSEVAGWAAVIALIVAAMFFHAQSVATVVQPGDPGSQGWTRFGGWAFFKFAVQESTALRAVPGWLSATLIPLSILGWASWRSHTGAIGFLLISGYALIFMTLGRPENFYWGLAIAPAFLMGLAFLRTALPDLFAAAWTRAPAGLSS